MGWRYSSVIQHMPGLHKVLSSVPDMKREERKEGERRREARKGEEKRAES